MMQVDPYHVHILQHELKRRLSANSLYSLRAFARDLGVSPSWLSKLINLKKGISEKQAVHIGNLLGLNQKELTLFLTSVTAHHARSSKSKSIALTKLGLLKKNVVSSRKLSIEEHEIIGSWYHLAILELTEVEGFNHTAKWLSQKLQIPIKLIEFAIEDLVRLNWLQIKNGKMKSVHLRSETTSDIPSLSIKKYHEEILKKALQELFIQPIPAREFLNLTLAFDKSEMLEAKKFIRQFQIDFADRFYSAKSKKNSVYQLSVQLFRIDKNEQEKKT